MMKHTDEMEKAEVAGISFLDCFRKSNLRRTEIVCTAWVDPSHIKLICSGCLCVGNTVFLRPAYD